MIQSSDYPQIKAEDSEEIEEVTPLDPNVFTSDDEESVDDEPLLIDDEEEDDEDEDELGSGDSEY
ncbi:MAG: hypothetical protein NT098_01220 [Candidatus Parcubacteria bacterium]|nr:hypothetical protein [Candidatus Parcubacteria bacterium]